MSTRQPYEPPPNIRTEKQKETEIYIEKPLKDLKNITEELYSYIPNAKHLGEIGSGLPISVQNNIDKLEIALDKLEYSFPDIRHLKHYKMIRKKSNTLKESANHWRNQERNGTILAGLTVGGGIGLVILGGISSNFVTTSIGFGLVGVCSWLFPIACDEYEKGRLLNSISEIYRFKDIAYDEILNEYMKFRK
jgi:hypothetical protein